MLHGRMRVHNLFRRVLGGAIGANMSFGDTVRSEICCRQSGQK